MWRALILLLAASPASAQGLPRAHCDYGEGLSRLRDAERQSALAVPGVTEGRARGERVLAALQGAVPVFQGCGCPRLAELTGEAVFVAQSAPSEATALRLGEVFGQIRFRVQLAREHAERQGCR